MRPAAHVLISATAGGLYYYWTRSVLAGLFCMGGGVLIDIDHLPEYVFFAGSRSSLKGFYYSNLSACKERIFLVLHSFELLILFWAFIWIFELNIFATAVLFGVTVHLLTDLLFNPIKSPLSYFFSFRALKGFKSSSIFGGEE